MTGQRIVELRRDIDVYGNRRCVNAGGELADAYERLRAEVRQMLKCTDCNRGECYDHPAQLEMLLDHPEPNEIGKAVRGRP